MSVSRFSVCLTFCVSFSHKILSVRWYSIEKGFWSKAFEVSFHHFPGNFGYCISYFFLGNGSKTNCFKNNLLFLMILWTDCTQLRSSLFYVEHFVYHIFDLQTEKQCRNQFIKRHTPHPDTLTHTLSPPTFCQPQ